MTIKCCGVRVFRGSFILIVNINILVAYNVIAGAFNAFMVCSGGRYALKPGHNAIVIFYVPHHREITRKLDIHTHTNIIIYYYIRMCIASVK